MNHKTITMATAAATAMQWPTQWTREDVKIFERALVMVPEDLPNRWEKIAEQVTGKSAAEVSHYENLVHEILEIQSGRIDVPNYPDDLVVNGGRGSSYSDSSKKTRHADKEKRKKKKKGRSWTEDEHKYVKDFPSILYRSKI
jgi:hypothetical protein